jgi:hypothetical protein
MCNGWKNRETWLVNLWFGDMFINDAEDGVAITADYIEHIVTEYVNEYISDAPFIADMIDMGAIDYDKLAAHYATDDEVVEG